MKLENIIVVIVFSLLFTACIVMFCANCESLPRIQPIDTIPEQQKNNILDEFDKVHEFHTVYKFQTVEDCIV
jgi:hypothetical protein